MRIEIVSRTSDFNFEPVADLNRAMEAENAF